jgi:6-phosphogluconolactonase
MPQTIVYVSCAAAAQVVRFRLDDATGALTPLGSTTVPGSLDPPPVGMAMALSPDHRVLYAVCRNPPYPVTAFAIGADGALSVIGSGHLAQAMHYIATDRTGRFLFGASYHGAVLSVNPIGADGVPGEPLQVLPTPPKAHSILPDPENRAVYAAVLGGDVILRQEFSLATGRLATPATPVAHTAPGAGPRHLRFARGGARLYCINELDGTVNTYARDAATGALTGLQSVRLAPPSKTPAAADLHLTPDERFLYASERASNVLAGFRLRPDGTLDALGTVPTEPEVRGFAIDPRGRWLLCASHTTGAVVVYGIDAHSGALTRRAACPAGANANWIEIIARPD